MEQYKICSRFSEFFLIAIMFLGGALVTPHILTVCAGDTEESETCEERAVNRESAVYNGACTRTQQDLSGQTNI